MPALPAALLAWSILGRPLEVLGLGDLSSKEGAVNATPTAPARPVAVLVAVPLAVLLATRLAAAAPAAPAASGVARELLRSDPVFLVAWEKVGGTRCGVPRVPRPTTGSISS